eukprot:s1297_g5.t1
MLNLHPGDSETSSCGLPQPVATRCHGEDLGVSHSLRCQPVGRDHWRKEDGKDQVSTWRPMEAVFSNRYPNSTCRDGPNNRFWIRWSYPGRWMRRLLSHRVQWARDAGSRVERRLAPRLPLQRQLEDAAAQEISALELQRLLSRCASARQGPSSLETSQALASAITPDVELETLVGLGRCVALLAAARTGRDSSPILEPLQRSVLQAAEAKLLNLTAPQIRALTCVVASISGSADFLTLAAERWRDAAEGPLEPKDWSLTLNAFAKGRLPATSLQALLRENLDLLESQFAAARWSPRDTALLCNALHRLSCDAPHGDAEGQRLHGFYARLMTQKDAPEFGPQDLAQLASALAAVSQVHRAEVAEGLHCLLRPWLVPDRAEELMGALSLEGICSLLQALHRLELLATPPSAPLLAAALRHLRRVPRQRLRPSHLGQLCSSLLDLDGDGATGCLQGDLQDFFSSILCPAIVASGHAFRQPNHCSLVLAALARAKDVGKALEAAEAVTEAMVKGAAWSSWPILHLVSITESLAALQLTAAAGATERPALAAALSSISEHFQQQWNEVPLGEAVRMAAALGLTEHPLEMETVEALAAKVAFQDARLPLRQLALWLRTLEHLEMRQVSLWKPILVQLHQALEEESWTLRMASRVLVAMDRLECFAEAEDSSILFISAKAAELLPGLPSETAASPSALSLAQLLLRHLGTLGTDAAWRDWFLERITYAAFALDLDAWRKYSSWEKFWQRHVFLFCRLASLDGHGEESVERRGQVQRMLRGALRTPLSTTPNERLQLLCAWSAAGFDLRQLDLAPAEKPWQAALLFPAVASSSIPAVEEAVSLSLVLEGLTTENAGDLALAAILTHFKSTGRPAAALLSAALERLEDVDRTVMVALQYLRFEDELRDLPLSTLRKLQKLKVENPSACLKKTGRTTWGVRFSWNELGIGCV